MRVGFVVAVVEAAGLAGVLGVGFWCGGVLGVGAFWAPCLGLWLTALDRVW
ncbi:hypothetical protein [Pyrobaculum ferrireducens]|uniref:hypothetical protein n=1 Tax=Pyrobaculum ferrireducens TaxID=1104324 RepID=UPI00130540B7|nr:hypothetical protein [Pyrobaculum ferrireducens]